MEQRTINEGPLREYLFGNLSPEEQRRLEERLLFDSEYIERLLIVEEEIIDAYLLGLLSPHERERFDVYFLSTPQRWRKLNNAKALRKYVAIAAEQTSREQPVGLWQKWQQVFLIAQGKIAIAAVIVLGLSFGFWQLLTRQSIVAKGSATLRMAYREQRPLEARISSFGYAPWPQLRGKDQNKLDYLVRDRAERLLLDAVSEAPGPASYHAIGQLYLAKKEFDKAINQFETALKATPNDAQLHSDLGAALLERGKARQLNEPSDKSLEDFAQSLDHLNKALNLNSSLLEAIFNRALLYQYMLLPQQAQDEWKSYLQKDSSFQWAEEARQNLKLVEEQRGKRVGEKEQFVQNFLAAYQAGNVEKAWEAVRWSYAKTGNVIGETLLDEYLELDSKAQGGKANRTLRMLSFIGELESSRVGDRYTLDLARFYSSVLPQKKRALIQARRLMRQGQRDSDQSKDDEVISAYKEAKQIFDQIGDICEARLAAYWLARSYLRQQAIEQGLSIFRELARVGESDNYTWLLVRSLHGLSSAQFKLNEHSKAIEYCNRSLELAERIGDVIGTLNALSSLTEYHRYLGNYHQALKYVQRSSPLIYTGSLEPVQLWRHYGIVASTFNSLGLYHAAAAYQKEALQLALKVGEYSMMCVSYTHLGAIYGKLENYPEALNYVRQALALAGKLPSEPVRQNMTAYSSLQTGHLYRQVKNFSKALDCYNLSIELYKKMDFSPHLYQAHKGRLLCYISLGNDALAQDELCETLKIVEQYRSKILEENNRDNFFNVEQSVYDLAIDFEYSRMKDSLKAFEYSESSRARSLLDLMSRDAWIIAKGYNPDITFKAVSRPLKLTDIQRRLPERVQVLQYAVLEDKLLIWLVSKSSVKVLERKIEQKELNEKVLGLLAAVSASAKDWNEDVLRIARELFDILITPIEADLDKSSQLCIITDKILNYLPYGALVSPVTGKFLLQQYILSYSPSSSLLVVCSENASEKGRFNFEKILSVGNPSFDHSAFSSFPDLPSANKEAEEIASYYNSPSLLVGNNATPGSVKVKMEKCEVIHLALHSVLDELFPLRSKLLLAKERKKPAHPMESVGALQAYEIYGFRLARTRLVVLSACQTGIEQYYNGEGMISLARPFIAAGVPLVVASLWPVESNSTAELMVSFHKYRKLDNLSTAQSLRQAQLDMLHSPGGRFKQPYYWASFVVIGGYAKF